MNIPRRPSFPEWPELNQVASYSTDCRTCLQHPHARSTPLVAVLAKNTKDGVRAVVKDQPLYPGQVSAYLGRAFGEDLAPVRLAMEQLAAAREVDVLADEAFALYECFRPQVASGKRGWGQKGDLNLDLIRSLARKV